MAKKHIFVSPRLVEKFPFLRHAIWLLESAVVRSIAGIVRALPPRQAYAFAEGLMRLLGPLLQFVQTIRRNLRLAFPDLDAAELDRLTRAVCGNLGRAAADLLVIRKLWSAHQDRFEFVFEEGAEFGARPQVIVSGHIGAWQLGSVLAPKYGVDVLTVYAPEQNPYLTSFYSHARAGMPVRFVSRVGCMRGLTRQLQQGHVVALTADTRAEDGVNVMFFGQPMLASTTPARLALHHGADLVPMRVDRLDDLRFRITLYRPIQAVPDLPAPEQAALMTARLFEHFEQWIREQPEQWMCFSRRWPKATYDAPTAPAHATIGCIGNRRAPS